MYYKKRTYRRRTVIRKRHFRKKGSLASYIKKVMHKEEEAHHYLLTSAQVLGDASIYTAGLTTEIPQGTGNGNRIGDRILLEAFKIRGRIDGFAGGNTVFVRFMVIKSGTEIAAGQAGGWNVTGINGLGATNLFLNNPTDTVNTTVIDPKRVTVLYDKTHELTPYLGTQVKSTHLDITVPIHKKYSYNASTAYGKFYQYYLVAIGYQLGATISSTAVGTITTTTDIIFKNLD